MADKYYDMDAMQAFYDELKKHLPTTVGFGTCATAAATATKEVVIDDENWKQVPGSIIGIKFTYSNSVSNVKLKVNDNEAASIFYNNAVYTSNGTTYTGNAGKIIYYMFDGTYWVWKGVDWNTDNNTYTSVYCGTGAATAAKVGTCTNYYNTTNPTYGVINIVYTNTAKSALTLNINSQGAKPLYINGQPSSTTNYDLPRGMYIFYWDGTNYYINTDGTIPFINSNIQVGTDLVNVNGVIKVNEVGCTVDSANNAFAAGQGNNVSGAAAFAAGQGNNVNGAGAAAFGQGNEISGIGTFVAGGYNKITGDYIHVFGYDNSASGDSVPGTFIAGYKNSAAWDIPGTIAMGYGSSAVSGTAIGSGNFASGVGAFAEGVKTFAGDYSHSEGWQTSSYGIESHSEGYKTIASSISHAEGSETSAIGYNSHAEGYSALASGAGSHAEGGFTNAIGGYSHTEGQNTNAIGSYSHAEGINTLASGIESHAEGCSTSALGSDAHAEGENTLALTANTHAEGSFTSAVGFNSHSEGYSAIASGIASHVEGQSTSAIGDGSHTEGSATKTIGYYSHAEGNNSSAIGEASHAEGFYSLVSGDYSHVEGEYTNALGFASHAEGAGTSAVSAYSHAEGFYSLVSGVCSHAEGNSTSAIGENSHSEGFNTCASGDNSHAEGNSTSAIGYNSHAEGTCTIAAAEGMHAAGKYNKTSAGALFVIGNGTNSNRSDALIVDSWGTLSATTLKAPLVSARTMNLTYLNGKAQIPTYHISNKPGKRLFSIHVPASTYNNTGLNGMSWGVGGCFYGTSGIGTDAAPWTVLFRATMRKPTTAANLERRIVCTRNSYFNMTATTYQLKFGVVSSQKYNEVVMDVYWIHNANYYGEYSYMIYHQNFNNGVTFELHNDDVYRNGDSTATLTTAHYSSLTTGNYYTW